MLDTIWTNDANPSTEKSLYYNYSLFKSSTPCLYENALTYPVVPCGSFKHGKAVTTLSANAFFSNAPGLYKTNMEIFSFCLHN